MSLSLSLFSALSGLQANQAALRVISGNVSNANTEGYTRKVAQAETVTLDGTAAGVKLSDLTRNVDSYLVGETNQSLSALKAIEVKTTFFQRIQDLYGQPDSNNSISARLSDLSSSLQELATTPESLPRQIDTVNQAVSVALQLNEMSNEIQSLRTQADQDIEVKLQIVNGQLEAIAKMNTDIVRGIAAGQPTADLEDQRDQAVRTLSEQIGVQTFTRTTGELVVMMPNGQILADSQAQTMTHTAAAQLDAGISYPAGIDGIFVLGTDITNTIPSGEIAGLVELRDDVLPAMQEELDRLTEMLRDELNRIHNQGAGLPPANTLTGSRSFANPAADTISFSSDVRIGVVDANGDFAAYYDIAAGNYTVSAIEGLIDANLAGFASASTSAGGPLSIGADDPTHGIAVADLGANTVTHTDGLTTYEGFANYFGLNDLFVTTANSSGDPITGIANIIQVRPDIAADQRLLTRGPLNSATGGSAPAVGAPAVSAGDSSVIQAMADRFGDKLTFAAAGGMGPAFTSLTGYGTDIITSNSIRASQSETEVEFRRSVFDQLSFRLQSDSGVNIDEELGNMIVFQNAYAAAAQVISATEELFDVLNGILR